MEYINFEELASEGLEENDLTINTPQEKPLIQDPSVVFLQLSLCIHYLKESMTIKKFHAPFQS